MDGGGVAVPFGALWKSCLCPWFKPEMMPPGLSIKRLLVCIAIKTNETVLGNDRMMHPLNWLYLEEVLWLRCYAYCTMWT